MSLGDYVGTTSAPVSPPVRPAKGLEVPEAAAVLQASRSWLALRGEDTEVEQ